MTSPALCQTGEVVDNKMFRMSDMLQLVGQGQEQAAGADGRSRWQEQAAGAAVRSKMTNEKWQMIYDQ